MTAIARTTDPATSHEAANECNKHSDDPNKPGAELEAVVRKAAIWLTVYRMDFTDRELESLCLTNGIVDFNITWESQSFRRCRKWLSDRGELVLTGERRDGKRVWKVAPTSTEAT
jgi:hypothetical protein